MKVEDRVFINTKGRLKWADGKSGTVKSVTENRYSDHDQIIVNVDGMDVSKPPFGLATVGFDEAEVITPEPAQETDISDDQVNHPSHYTDGKYECIDYMEHQGYTQDGYLFNAVKYISRAGKKDPNKYEEDIQKAIWYLNRKTEKARTMPKGISTKDYIQDKGLDNTLRGLALELIEHREYRLAAKLLQMDVNTHAEHST